MNWLLYERMNALFESSGFIQALVLLWETILYESTVRTLPIHS